MRFLIPLTPVPGKVYSLPKIHKDKTTERPIRVWHYIRIQIKFVHGLIRDMPSSIPSCIKEPTDFIAQTIFWSTPENSLLATLYIPSLYPNTPRENSINSVVFAYKKMNRRNKSVNNRTFLELLEIIQAIQTFELNKPLCGNKRYPDGH